MMSLLFGPLGDRRGYRGLLVAGLALMSGGMLLGGFFPFYGGVLAALFLAGLSKSIFDPGILAYLGENIPYHRRGAFIGITEMSWAGSSLIGLPLAGLLIDHMGWRSPFFVLGGLGLVCLFFLAMVIPRPRASDIPRSSLQFRDILRILTGNRTVGGALGFVFLFAGANEVFFVIYGLWLEESFHLSISALGMTAVVIGIAELLGEVLAASLSDRLGKKRALTAGLILTGMSYLLLPLSGGNLIFSLTALFIIFLTFEFTIVTSLSVFTEILPNARATMMSAYLTAGSLGRLFSALLAGFLWISGGIPAVGTASALISGLSLMILLWGMKTELKMKN
jgi:predicted MFS family arabinose efflux permease